MTMNIMDEHMTKEPTYDAGVVITALALMQCVDEQLSAFSEEELVRPESDEQIRAAYWQDKQDSHGSYEIRNYVLEIGVIADRIWHVLAKETHRWSSPQVAHDWEYCQFFIEHIADKDMDIYTVGGWGDLYWIEVLRSKFISTTESRIVELTRNLMAADSEEGFRIQKVASTKTRQAYSKLKQELEKKL